MKKIICVLLCCLITFSMASCGDKKPSEASSTPAQTKSEAAVISESSSEAQSSSQKQFQEEMMTPEEVKTMVRQKLDDGLKILIMFYNGTNSIEETPLSSDANFHRVTDERFNSVAALKAETEKIFSKQLAESTIYTGQFDGEYVHYKDFEDQLYVNTEVGGKGISGEFDTESLVIISQSAESLTVEMMLNRFDEPEDKHQVEMIKENGNWVFNTKIDL